MSKKVPKCFSYKFKETKSLHSAFHHQNPHKSRRRVSVRGHAQHVLSLCYLCSPPWACLSRASKSRSSNWSWEGDGSASLLASERRKQIHRISKGEEETRSRYGTRVQDENCPPINHLVCLASHVEPQERTDFHLFCVTACQATDTRVIHSPWCSH